MSHSDHKATEPRNLLGDVRRAQIAEWLRSAGSVAVAELEEHFGVSAMTARRDLADLERQGLARRTHGGAVLPSIGAREDSFVARVDRNTEGKRSLATAAAAMVEEHESVFLDGSSTAYYVASALLDRGIPLTVITNSLPVMELVATHTTPRVELIGVGGQLRALSRSFVGPYAVHTILGHFAERLFFSVKGVTGGGSITDADPLEAEVKRAMVAHSEHPVLLVDSSKLSARGLSVVGRVGDLSAVLVHGVDED